MNSEKFTNAFMQLLQDAFSVAQQNEHSSIQSLHLLHAALQNDFCLSGFKTLGIEANSLKNLVDEQLSKLSKVSGAQPTVDYSFQKFLSECEKIAKSLNDEFISLDVCMLGFATADSLPANIIDFFKQNNFVYETVLKWVESLRQGGKRENSEC